MAALVVDASYNRMDRKINECQQELTSIIARALTYEIDPPRYQVAIREIIYALNDTINNFIEMKTIINARIFNVAHDVNIANRAYLINRINILINEFNLLKTRLIDMLENVIPVYPTARGIFRKKMYPIYKKRAQSRRGSKHKIRGSKHKIRGSRRR